MKRNLMILALVVAMMAISAPLFAADEAVKVGVGSLKIGGVFQAGFNYYVGDETLVQNADGSYSAADRPEDMEFIVKRARLLFMGDVIEDRITYLAQLEFAQDSAVGMGDILLDMKMGFHYIPYTGIYVGRFLPNFTIFGPKSTAKLMLIDYPLVNAIAPAARQTGLDFGVVTPYLDADLGVFNGRAFFPPIVAPNANAPMGNQNWQDENTAKDIYFNLIGKPPVEGLTIHAGLWYGMPLDNFENDEGELIAHNASVMMIDAGVQYLAPFGLTFIGELMYATYDWDSADPTTNFEDDRDDDSYSVTSMAYYVMAGYNFGPMFEVPVELLVRYDALNPDTEDDEETPYHAMSEQDGLSNITVGVNYYIKKQYAMLSLNYINRGEELEDVGNKAGDDTQDGYSNDEVKLQAQISF
ncbi:MAG TPA: porin [bacterium]|nr:porin [bacterium]